MLNNSIIKYKICMLFAIFLFLSSCDYFLLSDSPRNNPNDLANPVPAAENFQARGIGDGEIMLTWNNSNYSSGFYIRRKIGDQAPVNTFDGQEIALQNVIVDTETGTYTAIDVTKPGSIYSKADSLTYRLWTTNGDDHFTDSGYDTAGVVNEVSHVPIESCVEYNVVSNVFTKDALAVNATYRESTTLVSVSMAVIPIYLILETDVYYEYAEFNIFIENVDTTVSPHVLGIGVLTHEIKSVLDADDTTEFLNIINDEANQNIEWGYSKTLTGANRNTWMSIKIPGDVLSKMTGILIVEDGPVISDNSPIPESVTFSSHSSANPPYVDLIYYH